MQPLWATTYGNGMLPLMEWYVTAIVMSYSLQQKCITICSSVLHFAARVSYSLPQQCLTVYGKGM
jgi:hypothetical protein